MYFSKKVDSVFFQPLIKQLGTILVILLLGFVQTKAQFYGTGQDPSSIKWKQIKVPGYQLVFPGEITHEVLDFARYLQQYDTLISIDSNTWRKTPIIFHPYTMTSNGYVTYAPRRMEIWTTPPPDIYSGPWNYQLALHEYRHVSQLSLLDKKLGKISYLLLGEQGPGAFSGTLPLWLYEGDAVYSETRFSNAGRGRDPDFLMPYKAIGIERRKPYSYNKAMFGSFKDFVPSYYSLGYLLVKETRKKYGDGLVDGMFKSASRYPFLVRPHNFYLYFNQKITEGKLYKQVFEDSKTRWGQDTSFSTIKKQVVLKDVEHFSSFTSPVVMDSFIITRKKSIDDITRFVKMDIPGVETEMIHTPGNTISDRVTGAKDYLTWDEHVPDPRWANRSYSVIKLLDLKHVKTKTLTRKSRYFAPAISPSGKVIAAIHVSTSNKYSIHLLDVNDGKLLAAIATPDNLYPQYPSWSADGKLLYMTLLSREGKSIYQLNIENQQWKMVLPPTSVNIEMPIAFKNYILFLTPLENARNICAIDKDDGSIYQLTDEKYGANDFDISDQEPVLYYGSYSMNGYQLVKSHMADLLWKKIEYLGTKEPHLDAGVQLPTTISNVDSLADYTIQDYKKWKHLFKVHSWAPFYYNYRDVISADPDIYPGLVIFSQNHLNNITGTLGYLYKEGNHILRTDADINLWYPAINVSMEHGQGVFVYPLSLQDSVDAPGNTHTLLTTQLYLPLNLSRGRYFRFFQPYLNFSMYDTPRYTQDLVYDGRGLSLVQPGFYFSIYQRTSSRDISPRLGFSVQANYQFSPFDGNYLRNISYSNLNLFLPGILAHQSIVTRLAYEQQPLSKRMLRGRVTLPRGYNTTGIFEQYMSASFNYVFPVFYPDLDLGFLLYLKRIRSTLFYDIGKGRAPISSGNELLTSARLFQSAGIELVADYHAFRFLFPFSTGVRLSYIPVQDVFQTGLIFSLDIGNF